MVAHLKIGATNGMECPHVYTRSLLSEVLVTVAIFYWKTGHGNMEMPYSCYRIISYSHEWRRIGWKQGYLEEDKWHTIGPWEHPLKPNLSLWSFWSSLWVWYLFLSILWGPMQQVPLHCEGWWAIKLALISLKLLLRYGCRINSLVFSHLAFSSQGCSLNFYLFFIAVYLKLSLP